MDAADGAGTVGSGQQPARTCGAEGAPSQRDLLRQTWNQAEAHAPLSTSWLTGEPEPEPLWIDSLVYDRSGPRTVDSAAVEPALTLLTSAWEFSDGWSPGFRLIDRDGEVLHQWAVPPEEIFADTVSRNQADLAHEYVHGSYLFPNGDVLVNVEYVGTARLNSCGEVLWQNSRFNFHHSLARAEDGSFWVPGVKRDRPAESERYPGGYEGLTGPIHHSLIVNLSESGEVLRTINVLDLLYENGLERHIPHSLYHRDQGLLHGRDVLHLNDVEPLPDSLADEYPLFAGGDLAVSLKFLNLVFVVDPDSGAIKWHASHPFSHQHDPDFVGDGWIGVFDNNVDGTERGTMLGGSRLVYVQPHTDSTDVRFPTPESDPFYTSYQGKWERLGNGRYLLSETRTGRVVEVTESGRSVWEWIQEPVDSTSVAKVTRATRVRLDSTQVASWPCSPGASRRDRAVPTS